MPIHRLTHDQPLVPSLRAKPSTPLSYPLPSNRSVPPSLAPTCVHAASPCNSLLATTLTIFPRLLSLPACPPLFPFPSSNSVSLSLHYTGILHTCKTCPTCATFISKSESLIKPWHGNALITFDYA